MSEMYNQSLKDSDPEVFATLSKELKRQQNQIELIAGTNSVKTSLDPLQFLTPRVQL